MPNYFKHSLFLYMLNVVVYNLFQVLNTRNKMSVVSPLTLLLLAALVHGSCAIQCYNCSSDYSEECDDPLDTMDSKVQKITCPSGMKACLKMKGRARRKNSSVFPVAASNCHKYIGLLDYSQIAYHRVTFLKVLKIFLFTEIR